MYLCACVLVYFCRLEAVTNIQNFNVTSIAIGVSGILLLMIFKKLNQRYLPDLPLPSQVWVLCGNFDVNIVACIDINDFPAISLFLIALLPPLLLLLLLLTIVALVLLLPVVPASVHV